MLGKNSLLIFTWTALLISSFFWTDTKVYADEEACVDGFIESTNCPCVICTNGYIEGTGIECDDASAYASVCGFVSSGRLVGKSSAVSNETLYDVGVPLKGITVSIYEYTPFHPTGQPYGNLHKKFSECVTTEEEGKYWCPMRRITPGNVVFVAFHCGGKLADLKMIPSVKSFFNLNSRVDCEGDYTYTPYPNLTPDNTDPKYGFDYTDRDNFTSCIANTPSDEIEDTIGFTPNIGIGDGAGDEVQTSYMSADIGEEGGEVRFAKFDGLSIGGLTVGEFGGSWWENDCIVRYVFSDWDSQSTSLSLDLGRDYDLGFDVIDYNSILEKCNFDSNKDGDGALEEREELTVPFRHDIPTLTTEHEQVRVWETRTSLQRANVDPKAFGQFNHAMFSECVGNILVRLYGSQVNETPISCEELRKCNLAIADPGRNTLIGSSFGANLASPASLMQIIDSQERNQDDVVCMDYNTLQVITIADIQPPIPMEGSTCKIGDANCPYLLPSDYYLPQFMIAAGAVREQKTAEAINDTFGGRQRELEWKPVETEADGGVGGGAHKGGDFLIYSDTSKARSNSGVTATRISTDDVSSVGGVLVNSFVSPIDSADGVYRYTADTFVMDLSENQRAVCAESAVTEEEFTYPLSSEEERDTDTLFLSNFFSGDEKSHSESASAEAATYATVWGKKRDAYMAGGDISLSMFSRDIFDSLLRYASGGASLEINNLLSMEFLASVFTRLISVFILPDNLEYKSFLDRVPEGVWTDIGLNPYMTVENCLGEDTFRVSFPAYGEDGFGEVDNGPCYPWYNLPVGEACKSYPGRSDQWDNLMSVMNGELNEDWPADWPGLEGNLRTCAFGPDGCAVYFRVDECDEFMCVNSPDPCPVADPLNEHDCIDTCGSENWQCADANNDGEIDIDESVERVDCNDAQEYTCLNNQIDTWRNYFEKLNWQFLDDPDDLVLNTNPQIIRQEGDKFLSCDLKRAGPMEVPGNIVKDHSARVRQELFDGSSQLDADPQCKSATYTALAFSNPTDPKPEACKAKTVDYATTNDMAKEIYSGDDAGATHYGTAGQVEQHGPGSGATLMLNQVVAHPMVPFVLTEEYPDPYYTCLQWPPEYEDEYGASVCSAVAPPGDLDFDNINVGTCGVTDECLAALGAESYMGDVVGAAGYNGAYKDPQDIQVPGAVILAAMAGESAFGGLWNWTNENIRSWSDPWYARLSNCNEMIPAAMPPFGLLDRSVDAAIAGGGYHPDRVNPDGIPIVSKCNFLDGAYMVGWMLGHGASDFPKTCPEWTRADAIRAIGIFEYGTNYNEANIPDRVMNVLSACMPN